METGNRIKTTSQVDLMNLVQKKLPNLYRDFGQNFNDTEAAYISERIALICASDSKISVCDVSIIGKAFDRLVLGNNSTFKISPKMIASEISAIATALDEEKRNNFTADRAKQDAILSNFKRGSASTPTSMACLWKLGKMCDGYDLRGQVVDKVTGEVTFKELITVEEVTRCYIEKLNPDRVFAEILSKCPRNAKIMKFQRF